MIIPKLSMACFVVRAIKLFVTQVTLKVVYHTYFHSLINYVIIGGNSSYNNSIFELQKRITRIIMGIGIRDSYREFFKILNILPLIFFLVLLVVNNKN